MSDTKKMIFDIIAKDHASSTFHKIGSETTKAGKSSHNFGKVAAAGLLAAGAAAAEFGKKSVEAYSDAAKETMALARVTGMTAKEASRLRFAGEESGVEFKTLSTSMKLFSKNLGGAADDSKKTAAMVHQLGFNFKDAHGKMLPMSALMPKLADRFKKMPDGPQKTALALKLFGRSGADMVKVLNKGSDGLKELAVQSDKTGNTIADTSSLKKNIQAQREFHAAISGLMITVGKLLMPVITKLSLFLTQHVAPAFTAVGKFVQQNHVIIGKLAPIVLSLVGGFIAIVKVLKIFTAVMAAVNFVLDANPIGIVVIAIAALAAGFIYAYKHSETFRTIVQGAFKAVSAAAGALWFAFKLYFKFIINAWLAVAGAIINGAAHAFGWVPGLGPKLKAAAGWFNDFKQRVNDQLNGIHDKTVKFRINAGNSFSDLNNIKSVLSEIKNKKVLLTVNTTYGNDLAKPHPHNASGTRFFAGGLTMINERGPELVTLPRGSGIDTAQATARALGQDGSDHHFTADVPLVLKLDSRVVWQGLAKLKHDRGGTSLGLA